MKYKAGRDIPKAVREIRSISPTEIRNWIRDHRTKSGKGGKKEQVIVTPESITMWFKRHPRIYEQLQVEVIEIEIPKEAITEALFQNGTFQEIPVIKDYLTELRANRVKEEHLKKNVNAIRQICLGIMPHKNVMEGWGLKHPQTVTLQDAKIYLAELQKLKLRSRRHRLALRSFFQFRNVKGWNKIGGEEEEDAGKYADLFVERAKIYEIFEELHKLNEDAYLACLFAFKTASRLTATLNADASFINKQEHIITVLEKAKSKKAKRKIPKYISPDLWIKLETRIERGGKLFRVEAEEINRLLRWIYKQVIPDIEKRVPMPFHFFRHMFAQHMLRRNNWNYSVVAKLGGWTTGALERYYGKMQFQTAVELGKESVANL